MTAATVAAVVVLYHPADSVAEHVVRLRDQCRRVVVVPNSPPDAVEDRLRTAGCEVLPYEGNGGTAGGFNRGIRQVLEGGGEEYVLLLDQDSAAPAGMVAALVAADQTGRVAGLRIAAVGPVLGDVKDAAPGAGGARDESRLRPAESLASSGTLVHRDALGVVGLMDEALFIDAVDHEWCLRAKSRGLTAYVVPAARLAHNMGDRLVRTLARRPRPLHDNPVRHYYIVRNSLLLLRRPYLSRTWKIRETALTIRRIVGYSLLSSRRAQTVRFIALAILDAARGRSGGLRVKTAK